MTLWPPRCRPFHRIANRGFTLIELMVAITAGMFVAVAAFAMARQGSRHFQQEARIASAQFSATVGFDRLRADLARAGFLSSANVQRDPRRCGDATSWPTGLKSLAAIRLENAQPDVAQDSTNHLTPDTITVSGSYTSAELFPVRAVVQQGAKYAVYLQLGTGAIQRTTGGQFDGGVLDTLFRTRRIMRLLEQSTGRYEFGVIDGYSPDSNGNPVVMLSSTPAIPFRRAQGTTCGVEGFGVGMQASVVNRIRYAIRDLRAVSDYAPIYANAAPGDSNRLELTRVELDSANNEMDGTLELVAEYAVDLRFAFTVVSSTPPAEPTLERLSFSDTRNGDYGGDVASKTTAGPERIRSVRARLAVRSREADRQANAFAAGDPRLGAEGNIFRYQMAGGLGFARVRTLTADIQLPNLARLSW